MILFHGSHVTVQEPEILTNGYYKDFGYGLILSTLQSDEDYVDGLIRVYNDEICETIDNYNCSAYYEPSYVITRAYNDGGF